MAKFTVLGAGGFIGRHLVGHLRRSGHDVWAPGRDDPAVYERDLGYAVYCIGVIRNRWQRLFDTAEAHVCKLVQILSRSQFQRLIYLSSVLVYEGFEGKADEGTELRFDPRQLTHLYHLSKVFGEALIYHAGRPATVVRLATVYDDHLAREDFLCRTVHRALGQGSLEVDAYPEGGRDYIHVDDVCLALERIALDAQQPAYNVASGTIFTNRELAEQCERVLGCRLAFRGESAMTRPTAVSIASLERDFDVRPRSAAQRLPDILKALHRGHDPA
jgi:nucleoside-diphosphate-sugar epimerase